MLKGVVFISATFSTQIFIAFIVYWLKIPVLATSFPNSKLSTYLNSAEMFIYFLTLCLIGIFIFDLRKSSLMHINLKFVCFLISFHISTVGILEIIIIIDKFTTNKYIPSLLKYIISVIHGCSRIHLTLDPAAAVIERGLATLKVSNYEKLTSKTKWMALMFVKEIFGIACFYVLNISPIGAMAFGIFWIFLLIITVIIGIILYRVNLKSYRTKIGTLYLTTRYQTVENIRCLKPVLIYSFLAVIQNIITLILLTLMFFQMSSNDFYGGSIIGNSINLIVAIFCIFYLLSFLIYSSRIRKFLKEKFNFFRNSRVSPNTVTVLSVMGKALTSTNDREIYFDQLQQSWN